MDNPLNISTKEMVQALARHEVFSGLDQDSLLQLEKIVSYKYEISRAKNQSFTKGNC